MKNELKIFENPEFGRIRTMEINGEPYFVGKDIALILGYAKPRNAIAAHVDEEDKKDAPIQGDLGGTQEMTVINESGLYSLILSSKLPTAKKFKHWVTSDVLPTIRKTGGYISNSDMMVETYFGNLPPEQKTVVKSMFESIEASQKKAKELETQVAQQGQIISELQPKASYYDEVLKSPTPIPVSLIAKDYGMSGQSFNKLLHEQGIQYKLGDCWLLYQNYANQGYTKSQTYVTNIGTTKLHTYWTQKGRLFLYDLLKNKAGIVPLMESEA